MTHVSIHGRFARGPARLRPDDCNATLQSPVRSGLPASEWRLSPGRAVKVIEMHCNSLIGQWRGHAVRVPLI